MPELIDNNGRRVASFTTKIHNLGRVAELTDAVIDIAVSGVWRNYQMATGHEAWREAELDYFLIACDMHYADVVRVLSWNKEAKALALMMDKNANGDRRRSLGEAAQAWHSLTGESLVERAGRLGWTHESGVMRKSPIPERARAQAKHGMTFEEHADENRRRRLPAARRHELDALATRVLGEVADGAERLYVLDRLRRGGSSRPATSTRELADWRAEAERLDWNTTALAEHWKVDQSTARRRVRRLREKED